MDGWYSIARAALDHAVLKHPARWIVFTRLIGMANFKPGTVVRRGHSVPLERGQVAVALRPWAEDIGLSYKEVRNALDVMEARGMLEASAWHSPKMGAEDGTTKGAICTIITLCKYDQYQHGTEKEGALKGATPGAKGAQRGRKGGAQQKKENKDTPIDSVAGGSGSSFEDWWSAYPRKVAKQAACKVWHAKVKAGSDPAAMLAGLTRASAGWQRDQTELHFIPHPATWLNGERWTDGGDSSPDQDRRRYLLALVR